MRPRTTRSATVALLVALASAPALVAAPAHAGDELGLSQDGRHWQDRLERPLFDPALRWVPGDVRTARFYVRNQDPEAGALTVDVERTRRESLIDSGYLAISARAGDGAWTAVADGGLGRILDPTDLATRRPVRVEVRVAMAPEAPNGTMVLATDLDFRVSLRAAVAVSSGSSDADLPDTGSPVAPWLPPLALGLLGAGAGLVLRRRRDEDDDPGHRGACGHLEESGTTP